jgi:hypothetical protein
MRIDSAVITGSFSVNGDTFNDLGSYSTTGSNTFVGNQSIVGAVSASALTGSINYTNLTDVPTLVSGSEQIVSILSPLNSYTQSNDTTNTTQNSRLNSLENKTGSLATTGSNTFYGTQVFSGSLFVQDNLVVQGSSSLQNITASAVSIGTNTVVLNTANPSVRFGGLSVVDSGSAAGKSGSLYFDSKDDEWIFVHQGNTAVTSSIMITGPETYDNIGNETRLTTNVIPKVQSGFHIVDSCIIDNGTTTCIKNNLIGTGTACFGGRICSPSLTTTSLRVSDETTFGLTLCKGSGGYPIIQSDLGQAIGFYNGEGGGTYNERLKIWQNGIITIGCQVCTPNIISTDSTITTLRIACSIIPYSNYRTSDCGYGGIDFFNSGKGYACAAKIYSFKTPSEYFGMTVDYGAGSSGQLALVACGPSGNSNIGFFAGSNCTEKMYINCSGNVGIGTTSPIDKLEVNGAIHVTGTAQTSKASEVYLDYYNGGARIGVLGPNSSTNPTFRLDSYRSDGSCYIQLIGVNATGNISFGGSGGFLPNNGTTAQRPSACTGMMRYNTSYNLMEFYNGSTWVQMGSGDLATGFCFNNLSMCHDVYRAAGTLGLQGQGSACITIYGPATPSMPTSNTGFQFATHGGHCGITDFPGYWGVNLGAARAVNQLKVWIHANSWGYFELQGSNNSGNASGFATNGTWTSLSFLCSNSNNCQNMGGNSSGCTDGTIFTFWYTNDVPFQAYRIKVLDSSRPNTALGTYYGGSAGYIWQLNRV